MRRLVFLNILLLLSFLVACGKVSVPPEPDKDVFMEPEPIPISIDHHEPITGGDEDEHGCFASAGYTWCEYTSRCERYWELAQEKGFANTADGFIEYCGQ